MGTYIITFRSVTPAQRAEKLLRSMGLSCHLGRTPRWMEEQGCGYSVRVRNMEAAALTALLRSHRISFRKLYLQAENGAMEEVAQ